MAKAEHGKAMRGTAKAWPGNALRGKAKAKLCEAARCAAQHCFALHGKGKARLRPAWQRLSKAEQGTA